MKFVSGLMMAGALALSATAAQADALSTPAMEGPLVANATPMSFDPGLDSPLYVTGSVSGLAQLQTNADHGAPGDGGSTLDLDNAWVSIQKTTGLFQFYVQAGIYSYPALGEPYVRSTDNTSPFGAVPIAYAKLQLSDTFSIEAGKLPTLIGAEYQNTTENINIERGLLWWVEPVNSRGVQANWASGPWSVSLSWNDGFYSDVWSTGSALVSYAFNGSNTLAAAASYTPSKGFAGLSNQIYNLIYTYNAAPFLLNPYIQYEKYDTDLGFHSENYGLGILASYQFTPNWSLGGRFEYETVSSNLGVPGVKFGFGAKKDGWSLTFTPTWQKGIYFIRGEASYTDVDPYEDASGFLSGGGLATTGFGTSGTKDDQFRLMAETGIVF
jgi:hypothetical protein